MSQDRVSHSADDWFWNIHLLMCDCDWLVKYPALTQLIQGILAMFLVENKNGLKYLNNYQMDYHEVWYAVPIWWTFMTLVIRWLSFRATMRLTFMVGGCLNNYWMDCHVVQTFMFLSVWFVITLLMADFYFGLWLKTSKTTTFTSASAVLCV